MILLKFFVALAFTVSALFLQPYHSAHAGYLESLILESVQTHPSILAQQEAHSAAISQVQAAKWQYYPTPMIGLDAIQAESGDSTYQGDDTSWTFGLSQPLYTGGRLKAGVSNAQAGVTIAEIDVYQQQQTIALNLVQAYGDWLSAHTQKQAWKASSLKHKRLQKLVERRVEIGLSPESDLSLAIGRYETTLAEIASFQAQEEAALNALMEILGRHINVDKLRIQSKHINNRTLDTLGKLLESARLKSPEVRRAISEVQRLESDIQLQKSALSPRVDLRAEYVEGSLTQDISGSEKRIFVNISSQLGAGLSSLSNIQVANKTKQAARARVTSQRRLVEQIVRSDFSQAELFQLRVKSLTRSVDTAQQVADSYERQFPVGRKSWLDVMNAVRDLVNTEVQLADTKAAHLVVTWRLTIIARGLSHLLKKDFVDVNNEFSKEQNEK